MAKEHKHELGWRVSVLLVPASHPVINYVTKILFLDVRMEKEEKQELGWRVPIPAFHHCELYYMYTVYSGVQEWVIQIPSIPILLFFHPIRDCSSNLYVGMRVVEMF